MTVGKLRPAGRSLTALFGIICGITIVVGNFPARAADPAAKGKTSPAPRKPTAAAAKTPMRTGKRTTAPRKPAKTAIRQTAATRKTRSLPSVKAIQAAYKKNFAKLMPLGVEYRITIAEHPAAIDEEQRRLREKQLFLKAKRADIKINGQVIDDDQYNAIAARTQEEVQYLTAALAEESVKRRLAGWTTEHRYLWTDGQAFHLRSPHVGSADDVNLFPAPLTSPDNLAKLYGSIVVASWSKTNTPPLRCWFGGSNGGQGRVAKGLQECLSMTSFAPLGFINDDWTQKRDWHELDHFMAADPNHFRVVQKTEIKGRAMFIIEEVPADSKSDRYERVRAWIDPSQGCLPLRLEWSYVNTADKTVAPYHRDLQVLAVKQIAGGFYPERMRRRELMYDYQAAEKQRQEQAAGKVAKDAAAPPLVPARTISFEATEISAQKDIEPAALALEFPVGTLYTNTTDNETYRAGDSEPLPPPPEPIRPGQVAPPLKIATWTDGKARQIDNFKGHVVVLVFTQQLGATKEDERNDDAIAAMKGLYKTYAPKGAVFLEIFGAGSEMQRVQEFQKTRGWKTLAGIDELADPNAGATSLKYLAGNDAGFVIIGRNGRVAFNADALEEETAMQEFADAAKALSIPWPLDENASEEELDRQQFKIFEYIASRQIERALATGK